MEQWEKSSYKNKYIFYALFGLLIIIILGLFYQIRTKDKKFSVVSEDVNQISEMDNELSNSLEYIYVDLKGAVVSPNVYRIELGSRLFDLLDIAGGLTDEAAINYINQAEILRDQMIVYIPSLSDITNGIESSGTNQAFLDYKESDSHKININTADHDTLQALSGIGAKKAEQIISYREENGSFQQIEDLMNVPGIGSKTFERLQDEITVY